MNKEINGFLFKRNSYYKKNKSAVKYVYISEQKKNKQKQQLHILIVQKYMCNLFNMSICPESDWRVWRNVSVRHCRLDWYTWTLAAGCLAGSWTSLCALLIVLGTSWNAAQCCPHNRARLHVRPWPIPGINHVWLPVKNFTIINLTKRFINDHSSI